MKARLDTLARAWAIASLVGWVALLAFVLGSVGNVEQAGAATADGAATGAVIHLEQRRDTPRTSVERVSGSVMCPSCDTTLDQSNSPAAERMRAWVRVAVAAGWTDAEIRDGLVKEYGGDESILAVPRARGIGLAVWLVPAAVVLIALLAGVLLMHRWRSVGATQDSVASTSSSSSHADGSSTGASSSHADVVADAAAASPSAPPSSR